jgi:hypothetical protein
MRWARGSCARGVIAALAFASVGLAGCATNHFHEVVQTAARQDGYGRGARVTALNSWAFRVDAEIGTLYYRCHYQRHSMGRTQCCSPVDSEAKAVAVFSVEHDDATCLEYYE